MPHEISSSTLDNQGSGNGRLKDKIRNAAGYAKGK
jgi:hypothetical protein